MFNSNCGASVPLVASIDGGNGGNNGNGMWGDGGWWVLIILFALIFWGNGNWGGNNGGNGATSAALTRGDLCMDMNFSQLENSVRGIADGICSLGYDQLAQINAVNNSINTGFSNLNSTICQQQYDTAQMINAMNISNLQNANAANVVALQNANAIQTQLAECCCNTREAIQANTTQGVMNTNAIQNQIQQCCCANEKDLMQLNYNLATQNCNTLQAIDKVGDRIIDYLAADKAQALRDENQALRLAASQQAQNNYLISHLNPTPVPAYPAASPCGLGNWSPAVLANGYGYNNGFGCGCGCNSGCGCA